LFAYSLSGFPTFVPISIRRKAEGLLSSVFNPKTITVLPPFASRVPPRSVALSHACGFSITFSQIDLTGPSIASPSAPLGREARNTLLFSPPPSSRLQGCFLVVWSVKYAARHLLMTSLE